MTLEYKASIQPQEWKIQSSYTGQFCILYLHVQSGVKSNSTKIFSHRLKCIYMYFVSSPEHKMITMIKKLSTLMIETPGDKGLVVQNLQHH